MKQTIENIQFDAERALYNAQDVALISCRFAGETDGESALKESHRIEMTKCDFLLRYPLWHATDFSMTDCVMTETARAAIWYAKNVELKRCTLGGIKAVRESENVHIMDSTVDSPEFGWQCNKVTVENSSLKSEYIFLHSNDVTLNHMKFQGNYSFQYTSNLRISNSELDTKDAFWHSKNAVLRDSVIKGAYLGWYSEGLTLINCRIIGTQPLCYCKNLTLVNCTMEQCDLAFEYSDVQAEVHGHIDSAKNPRSGKIAVDSIGEIIRENAVMECNAEIITKN